MVYVYKFSFVLYFWTFGLMNHGSQSQLQLIRTPRQSSFRPIYPYTSYMKGMPYCSPSNPIQLPKTKQDVIDLVNYARRTNTTIKPFGARHSGTDVICTQGIPMDMSRINSLKYNPEDKTVTVGAGASLRSIVKFLHTHGRALESIPGFGNITLGGCIGTGAHSSSLKWRPTVSEQIVGILLVDGRGQLRRIVKEEDLKIFRVHLGLLGVILEVTLRTVPIYKLRGYNSIISDSILTDSNGLRNLLTTTDFVSLYWFPAYKKVVFANWTKVDPSTPGNAWTNDHVPNPSQSANFISSNALEMYQLQNSTESLNFFQGVGFVTLLRKIALYPPIYTEDGKTLTNPGVGFYYDMIAPICGKEGEENQCPWFHGENGWRFLIQEFSIELHKLPGLIRTVRDILKKHPAVFPLQGILMRFSGPSESAIMGLNYRKAVCHFEFYVVLRKNDKDSPSLGLGAYQAIVQSLVKKYGAVSHWGKSASVYHSTKFLTQRLDPAIHQPFLKKMKEFDPDRIFMNNFGERLLGESNIQDIDPTIKHCALLDNCFCSHDTDCANRQKCTKLRGYPDYPICAYPDGLYEPKKEVLDYTSISLTQWFIKLGIVMRRWNNGYYEKEP